MKISKRVAVIVFLAYLCIVFYLCLGKFSPNDESWLPPVLLGIPIDKYIHFCMFFPLPFTVFFAFKGKKYWKSLIIIFFVSIMIAAVAEYSQKFTSYRTVDIKDFIANASAITLGTIIIALLKHKFSRNGEQSV